MIDLALLRIIKHKEAFDKVHRYIPMSAIDKKTKAITQDIAKYFELNPDEETIDFPSFRSMFFTTWHKGMKEDDIAFYNGVLTRMEAEASENIKKTIINQLLTLEFATKVGNAIAEYELGEEIELVPVLSDLVKSVQETLERTQSFEFATAMDSTIGEENADVGYEWCVPMMNTHYRKIQGGDQYIVAARPGKGKTTFLTHNNWAMAQEMPLNKVIVWFNNESRKERIMSRQIQSALYMYTSELEAVKQQGKLKDKYIEAMGRIDRVRVYDVHGMNSAQLEEILETIGIDNIGAIVFDMLDKVKFPTRRELREDQRLEALYDWSRELAVKYNCPSFPTSQVSVEGAGLLFPTEFMLKDSKTGKQGACDGIIMIGHSNDPIAAKLRGLSMPKTKSKREGQDDMHEEVILDADRGRYV